MPRSDRRSRSRGCLPVTERRDPELMAIESIGRALEPLDQWPPQAPSFREGSRRPEFVIGSKDIAGPAGGTPGPGGRKTRRACEDPVPLKTPEASGPSRKAPPRGVARNPGLQAGVVHVAQRERVLKWASERFRLNLYNIVADVQEESRRAEASDG
jgi:hypothetical protein